MYFVKAKWPRDWITTAEGILRDEWTKHYKKSVEPGPAETMVLLRVVPMIDFGAVGDELLVHIDTDSFTDLAEASRASTCSSYSVFASI